MSTTIYADMLLELGAALTKAGQRLAAESAAAPTLSLDITEPVDPEAEHDLGPRQRQILEQLRGLRGSEGLKTGQIANAIGYEVPNTQTTLQSLVRKGIVELIAGVSPQTWRLAPKYRVGGEGFAQVAALVRQGEWTTYGDVSIVMLGSTAGARGVGRAAATMPDFPAPHRLLMKGGYISADWHTEDGEGPEECRRRLEADGIRFVDGHADPAQRVDVEELIERLRQHQADALGDNPAA
ncbi:MAG TPA: hypothetical protein VHD87_12945 [Acidimicrobiales bacterium]|nr:hypothetical protein [Acidimicrobiales bacterium]